uniref:Transposase n=1 Tax=Klebsiella pneumoniae TaxID=573 RepID=A0A8B0SWB0_KLEPN|nr:Transposase [Klebsiella pneumoniae]
MKRGIFTCPSTSTIGRIIAGAHDKMRMIPVRLSAEGQSPVDKKTLSEAQKTKNNTAR